MNEAEPDRLRAQPPGRTPGEVLKVELRWPRGLLPGEDDAPAVRKEVAPAVGLDRPARKLARGARTRREQDEPRRRRHERRECPATVGRERVGEALPEADDGRAVDRPHRDCADGRARHAELGEEQAAPVAADPRRERPAEPREVALEGEAGSADHHGGAVRVLRDEGEPGRRDVVEHGLPRDAQHDASRPGEGSRPYFPLAAAPQDLRPPGAPGEPRDHSVVPGGAGAKDHPSRAVHDHQLPAEALAERVLHEGGRLPVRPHPEVGQPPGRLVHHVAGGQLEPPRRSGVAHERDLAARPGPVAGLDGADDLAGGAAGERKAPERSRGSERAGHSRRRSRTRSSPEEEMAKSCVSSGPNVSSSGSDSRFMWSRKGSPPQAALKTTVWPSDVKRAPRTGPRANVRGCSSGGPAPGRPCQRTPRATPAPRATATARAARPRRLHRVPASRAATGGGERSRDPRGPRRDRPRTGTAARDPWPGTAEGHAPRAGEGAPAGPPRRDPPSESRTRCRGRSRAGRRASP